MDNYSQCYGKMGVTYDELVNVKPDIIVLNMPTMGKGGIYEHHRAESWNLMAMAGFNYMSGTEGISLSVQVYIHIQMSL